LSRTRRSRKVEHKPAESRRERPPIEIEYGPPDGMDEGEAQEVVTAALVSLREGAR
jgi:hypothetical protein